MTALKMSSKKTFDPDEFVSPFHGYFSDYWERLSPEEKQTMYTYRNHLNKDTDPKSMQKIIDAVSVIYDKYPDFNIAHMP